MNFSMVALILSAINNYYCNLKNVALNPTKEGIVSCVAEEAKKWKHIQTKSVSIDDWYIQLQAGVVEAWTYEVRIRQCFWIGKKHPLKRYMKIGNNLRFDSFDAIKLIRQPHTSILWIGVAGRVYSRGFLIISRTSIINFRVRGN